MVSKMVKLDLKKKYKELYTSKPGEPIIVNVPTFKYLMIDGKGYPGTSQEYQDAMQTLYPLSYTLKFTMKSKNKDYTVMPLEGLWWAEDFKVFTTEFMERKGEWLWTSMVVQPDFITQELLDQTIKDLQTKEKLLPSLDKLRFESYNEGLSGQIMHIGPYSEEGPNIEKLHSKIKEEGGIFDGHIQKHHEIYLSDPRRTKPERLKTVIRQPFKK
ncbi:MAG: GyrI-like domain-containing protein [Candidatus Hodarchaeales archaeon]